jgi:hypothetical protein
MTGVEYEEDKEDPLSFSLCATQRPSFVLTEAAEKICCSMCAWMIETYRLRCERPLSEKLLTKGRTVPDRVSFGSGLLSQETVCR